MRRDKISAKVQAENFSAEYEGSAEIFAFNIFFYIFMQ